MTSGFPSSMPNQQQPENLLHDIAGSLPMTTIAPPLKRAVPPIRSLVLVKADQALLNRALDAKADALWLDLEEPQYPYGDRERQAARKCISEYMESPDAAKKGSPLAFVRVTNPNEGETLGDLRAAVTPALTGVLLPKVESPADVYRLDGLLNAVEHERGIAQGSIQLIPLLESPAGMRRAYDVAIASPRITYMGGMISAFGDLHREFGYRWTPKGEETDYLRAKILTDARAAGIRYPISGMWGGSMQDVEGMTSWMQSLRSMGYYGMASTVEMIPLVNEIFSPTREELDYWIRIAAQGDIVGGVAADPGGYPFPSIPRAFIESARWNLAWARDLGIQV
jgi:citrate lyase subunit beta / citryl-CoA lyase